MILHGIRNFMASQFESCEKFDAIIFPFGGGRDYTAAVNNRRAYANFEILLLSAIENGTDTAANGNSFNVGEQNNHEETDMAYVLGGFLFVVGENRKGFRIQGFRTIFSGTVLFFNIPYLAA